MESFVAVLSAGGHTNSLGRSQEVLTLLRHDQTRLDELFACIAHDDAWVRMRAIDTFEKLVRDTPTLARPYTDRLIGELTQSRQPSVQWHLAQLFMIIELDATQRAIVLSWLKTVIASPDIDWIVAANVMKALDNFYGKGCISKSELVALVSVQQSHISKTVRGKAEALVSTYKK